jgi:membrane fusion protein, hemolysin D
MPSDALALKEVRRFQSEVSYLREAPDPYAARLTIYIIVGAFLALGGIAFFAHVDRVVSSVAGKIVTADGPIVFQALDTSIVRNLNVREGDLVRKGEILATLDPTFAHADLAELHQQIASLKAQTLRDHAELSGKPLQFPAESDPDEAHYAALQTALYLDRQTQYAAQLRSFDEKLGQLNATLVQLNNQLVDLDGRFKIAKKIEDMRTTLAKMGAGSLLNQLASQDNRLQSEMTATSTRDSIRQTQHQRSSLEADRAAFVSAWAADLRKELVTGQNALDLAEAQYQKAQVHNDLVAIRANEDVIVLTLAKLSVGSVLKEGDPIYTAVPVNSPLQADVDILARDIGFVRPGDHVTLKVDAFNFVEHGMAEGEVKWISDGAFSVSEDTNQPTDAYYRARVEIQKMNFIAVPKNFRLIPGMTLRADINVGKRSLAGYLSEGFVRGAGEAMREP